MKIRGLGQNFDLPDGDLLYRRPALQIRRIFEWDRRFQIFRGYRLDDGASRDLVP